MASRKPGTQIMYVQFQDGSFGIKLEPMTKIKSFEDFKKFIDKDPILEPAFKLLSHLDHGYLKDSVFARNRIGYLDSEEFKNLSPNRKKCVRFSTERAEAALFFEEEIMRYICQLVEERSNAKRDEIINKKKGGKKNA